MTQEHVALINFFICSGIFWTCLCRLNSPPSKMFKAVRARYVFLLAGSSLSALQPTLLLTWPTWADVFFAGVVLSFLFLSMNKWRKPYDANIMGERRGKDATNNI